MASDSYSPHPEFCYPIVPPPLMCDSWMLLLWEYGLTARSACSSDTPEPEAKKPLVKLEVMHRGAWCLDYKSNLVRFWVEVWRRTTCFTFHCKAGSEHRVWWQLDLDGFQTNPPQPCKERKKKGLGLFSASHQQIRFQMIAHAAQQWVIISSSCTH